MLTREQIEEIQTESREKGIPVKNLLKEKGIPDHQYFWWKRKYSRQEVCYYRYLNRYISILS